MKNLNTSTFGGYSAGDSHNCLLRLIFFIVLVTFGLSGCAMLGLKKESGIKLPVSSEVKGKKDQLRPGLSVVYFHGFYRNIYQMPRGKNAMRKGIPGKPIPLLDHKFGDGMVFDSGRAKGVGMQMDGFILFEKTGDYIFQANTNDGFRLLISGMEILEDPLYHSDRMSSEVKVTVSEPGWYPLQILYFQRKGTATIQLFWKKPGDSETAIVPAEAFCHMPSKG